VTLSPDALAVALTLAMACCVLAAVMGTFLEARTRVRARRLLRASHDAGLATVAAALRSRPGDAALLDEANLKMVEAIRDLPPGDRRRFAAGFARRSRVAIWRYAEDMLPGASEAA
jgi:hypothetical protein